jgi:hypothetical protein
MSLGKIQQVKFILIPLQKLSVCSADQKIPCLLWNTKFHYLAHKSLPPVSIISHINSIHTIQSHFLQIHLCVFYGKFNITLRKYWLINLSFHVNSCTVNSSGNVLWNFQKLGSTGLSHIILKMEIIDYLTFVKLWKKVHLVLMNTALLVWTKLRNFCHPDKAPSA